MACIPAAPAAAQTKWLCRPGLADNPCASSRATTAVTASGATRPVAERKRRRRPRVDCFYVYPTVSGQPTLNADLRVDQAVRSVAALQASRFAPVCRIYAPVYRQVTISGLFRLPQVFQGVDLAYADVVAAWREYLRRFNRRRGVVLIGHSQGTGMLRRLIADRIDRQRSVRRRVVSALLIGGNVKVRAGRDVGGDFKHIRACRSSRQTGCVVAFSSFNATPPGSTLFGRVGAGFDLIFRGPVGSNLRVLCVNPAALTSRSRALRPYFATSSIRSLTSVRTPWVTFPGLYRARCRAQGGVNWLQVDDVGASGDPRPRVAPALGPTWGLHLADVNVALGNLVELADRQAAAYVRRTASRRKHR
jgi:hypothetical protein